MYQKFEPSSAGSPLPKEGHPEGWAKRKQKGNPAPFSQQTKVHPGAALEGMICTLILSEISLIPPDEVSLLHSFVVFSFMSSCTFLSLPDDDDDNFVTVDP